MHARNIQIHDKNYPLEVLTYQVLVTQACNPSTWEAEVGGSQEFKASWIYVTTLSQKENKSFSPGLKDQVQVIIAMAGLRHHI